MADSTLVVKKYGNRRLYDTERSQYITLDDLAQLVRSGRDVKVVDAKTNANLTKTVLLQIITEQEKDKDLLPVSFLKQMIQISDSSIRDALQRYLTLSLETFLKAQSEFEQRYRNMAGNLMNPLMWLMPPFAQMQQGGPHPPAPSGAPQAVEPPPEGEPPEPVEPDVQAEDDGEDPQQQIQTLKAQVAQIQQLLAKLEK
jgi:polyhydroxyalkanoate synthesis repressor PhaR